MFNDEVKNVLELDNINSNAMFEKLFIKVLDKHAPVKKKIVRANHAKCISKPFRKAKKNQTTQSLERYKTQKNYCNRLKMMNCYKMIKILLKK